MKKTDYSKYILKYESCPLCRESIEITDFLYFADGNLTLEGIGRDSKILKCKKCGMVFSEEYLNEEGLGVFWYDFSSKVHEANEEDVINRDKMYDMEYEFIESILKPNSKILDVGAGEGGFLDKFAKNHQCCGVEIGEEAAEKLGSKYRLYKGEFPKLEINEKFDLIIFRGSIQYFTEPNDYFEKAISLLNPEGMIFITSSPNMDSFCHKLFGRKFSIHMSAVACCGFNPEVLKNYFKGKGLHLCAEKYFYEGTPYANPAEDIKKVSEAIKIKEEGKTIEFKSPAFWGNMMSLVFRKN